MAVYEIPLINTNQKFNINLNGTTYKLQVIYRRSKWFLDLMDTTENYLISAMPMVMGTNLLSQHQHIIKGGLHVVNINENEEQFFNDLGNKITLYWSDE